MKKIMRSLIVLLFIAFLFVPSVVHAEGFYYISPKASTAYRIDDTPKLSLSNNKSNQKFKITQFSDGTYKLSSGNNLGKSLTADLTWAKNNNQKWQIIQNADKSYQLISNGKALTYSRLSNNATLSLTTKSSDEKQKFLLIPYTGDKYTVIFTDGQSRLKIQSVKKNEAAIPPSNPQRQGYTFNGWDKAFNKITGNTTVNAKWIANKYTVTFTDGFGNVLKKDTVEYGKSAIAPTNPTKTGYTFSGWDKTFNKITGNLTVNAKWDYTVTFVDNGKILKKEAVAKGKSATAPANPIKTGYTFAGWDIAFTNVQGNLTVNAKWNINKYTVKFSDGTKIISTQTVEYGKTATAPTNPKKVGYEFAGWDKSLKITANTTITAKWNPYKLTINYYAGEATGDAKKVWNGANNLMKTVTYSYDGTDFSQYGLPNTDGGTWNLTKKGYVPKAEFLAGNKRISQNTNYPKVQDLAKALGVDLSTGNKTINLYAVMEPEVYNINYVLNGGTNNTSNPKTYTIESNVITLKNPTKIGYVFAGWKEGNTIAKGSTGNKTFTAQWNANTFTVTFVDGTGKTLKTQSVKNGESATAPANPTRIGYTFNKWDKDFNKITANTTITALWNINKYNISFNANGGAGTMAALTSKDYNSSVTLTANAFTRAGYTFNGWNTASNGSGTSYANKATLKIPTSNITLYAQWKPNTYTVTFVDGTGKTLKTQSVKSGESATAPTIPTRTGYTFNKWDKAFNKITANTTITALWNINKYNISFNGNGSTSGSVATISSKEYRSSVKLSNNTFVRTGYTFKNWNTKADGTGTAYVDKAILTVPANNVTLYAQWTPVTYTVTFKDGNTVLKTEKVTHGSNANPPTVKDKTGYTFAKWDKSLKNVTSNMTYNVVWNTNKYKVTFVGCDNKYTQEVEYGQAAKEPSIRIPESKLFVGWDKKFDKITADLTVNAIFKDKILVAFFNGSTLLKSEYVEAGKSATPPTVASKTGYTLSWDKAYTNIKNTTAIHTVWTPKIVNVTFNSNFPNNAMTYAEKYTYGNTAQKFGQSLTSFTGDFGSWKRAGYQLSGWSFDKNATTKQYTVYSNVADSWINTYAGKVTLYAVWTPTKYTVKFTDGLGKTINTQQIGRYNSAVAPSAPIREGYKFNGWDNSYTNVKNNITVNAKMEPVLKINTTQDSTFVTGEIDLKATIGNSAKLTYTSSNPQAATVNNLGVVKGVSAGTTTITVKSATGQTVTKKITVYELTKYAEGWIQMKSGSVSVDVPSSKDTKGLQLQTYTTNTSNAQKFQLKKIGELYNIFTANGLALESSGGKIIQNTYSSTNTYQKWKMVRYNTKKILVNVGTNHPISLSGNKLVDSATFPGLQLTFENVLDPSFGAPITGWVEISPKENSAVRLDVSNNDAHSDTNIGLWTKNGNNAQKYYITSIGNGLYKIATGSTFKKRYLTALDDGNVKQMDANTGTNQQWYIYKSRDGLYEFKNKKSNKCLDVANGNAKARTNIQTFSDNDTNAQRFYIHSSSAPTGSAYYPITYKRRWNFIVRDSLNATEKTVFDEALKNLNTDNTALEVGKGKVDNKKMATNIINALDNQYYYQAVYYKDGDKAGTKTADCYTYNEKNKSIIINAKKCRKTFQDTKALENLVQTVSKSIFKSGMTERQAVEAANNWMVKNLKYKIHHNLNYIVSHREAECDGFARFFELLMDVAGVDSKYVSGFASPFTKNDGHGWNYVNVEDTWYYIDVTWNNTGSPKNKYYLTTKLWTDHKVVGTYYFY